MPDIRLQRGDGNLGLRGIETPDDSGDRAVSVDYLNAHTTDNSAHPLNEWNGTTAYFTGDQVLHNGGSNVYSIYIANKDIAAPAAGETNAQPQTRDGQPDWYLSRSGIVSVQGPDDIGPAGLTANDTLRLHAGGGIAISRSGADFTISQEGHGHSDPDNWSEGFVYSFTDISVLNSGYHHGTVGSEIGSFQITSARLTVRGDGSETVELFGRPVGGTIAQGIYGFLTTVDNRGDITPNRADENSIIYVSVEQTTPVGGIVTALVLQADPSFTSQGNIANVLNLQGNVDANRQINRTLTIAQTVGLWGLVDDGTAGTVADWAHSGNTDPIPSEKFEALSAAPPTMWADGNAFAHINDEWLPTDIVHTTDNIDALMDVHYTTAVPVAGERLVYRAATADDAAGWYNEAGTLENLSDFRNTAIPGQLIIYREASDGLTPTVTEDGFYAEDGQLAFLEDVAFARPDDETQDGVVQGVQWSASADAWINAQLPDAGLDLTQGTETVGPDFRGQFVQIQQPVDPAMPDAPRINFVAQAYIVPATQYAITANQTPSLFVGDDAATFTYSITNWAGDNNPGITIVNTVGTGTVRYVETSGSPATGGQFLVAGLDTDTLNSFSFDYEVRDGLGTTSAILDQGTRTVTFTDRRSLEFTTGPTVFAANSAVDYLYQVTQRNGLVVQDGDYVVRLNNVVISPTANRSGSILRSDANWVLGNNTVSITGTDEQLVPSIPRNVTRNVTTVRPFYFWQQDTEVTQTDDFDGEVLQTFSAGRSLTASTAGTWWLAYPMDLGTFQYRTMRGGLIVTPTVSTRFFLEPFFGILDTTDARRRYTVLEFTGVSAGTTFDVETP